MNERAKCNVNYRPFDHQKRKDQSLILDQASHPSGEIMAISNLIISKTFIRYLGIWFQIEICFGNRRKSKTLRKHGSAFRQYGHHDDAVNTYPLP